MKQVALKLGLEVEAGFYKGKEIREGAFQCHSLFLYGLHLANTYLY